MPLMAAYEHNDARETARLLASMTLQGLRHDRNDALVGNAINNMYRLLQGYRAHGFYGYVEDRRIHEEGSTTSLLTSTDRNVTDLKHALDSAFCTVFGDVDPHQAIEGMKVVLRMTAYPRAEDAVDVGEAQRAEAFFSTLLHNLEG